MAQPIPTPGGTYVNAGGLTLTTSAGNAMAGPLVISNNAIVTVAAATPAMLTRRHVDHHQFGGALNLANNSRRG